MRKNEKERDRDESGTKNERVRLIKRVTETGYGRRERVTDTETRRERGIGKDLILSRQ